MFGAVYAADGSATGVLIEVAREFSPRVEIGGPRALDAAGARQVVLDLSGLARLFGDARAMGEELLRAAADRGLRVRVAIAGTRTAARMLACAGSGQSAVGSGQWAVGRNRLATADCRLPTDMIIVEPGTEAAALAALPLAVLAHVANENGPNDSNDLLKTFRRWGLRIVGDVAALPPDALAARLGQEGVRWQRLARGEDPRPLLPAVPDERFEQALDLEWPIEGLEPLSFVLGRLMEPLSAHLERRGCGAAVLHVRLHLVTRAVYERSLQLPAPMRDARTLRTLALLDLESHPPAAAIDRMVVAVDPTPARVLQFSLLTRPLPSPEQLSTLMARLDALMGEGRCGSPAAVDSWQPGVFAMKAFAPADPNSLHRDGTPRHRDIEVSKVHGIPGLGASVPRCSVEVSHAAHHPAVAFRRFRFPVPARVRVEQGKPSRVAADRRGLSGGRVETCAGPWRTSGGWWTANPHCDEPHKAGPGGGKAWDRDEWDVTLSDGATYRVFRDRSTDAWFIEGIVD